MSLLDNMVTRLPKWLNWVYAYNNPLSPPPPPKKNMTGSDLNFLFSLSLWRDTGWSALSHPRSHPWGHTPRSHLQVPPFPPHWQHCRGSGQTKKCVLLNLTDWPFTFLLGLNQLFYWNVSHTRNFIFLLFLDNNFKPKQPKYHGCFSPQIRHFNMAI